MRTIIPCHSLFDFVTELDKSCRNGVFYHLEGATTVRICPQCKGEFQDWVASCPDCHIDLIEAPPPASKAPPIYWITEVDLRSNRPSVRIGVLGFVAVIVIALLLIAGVSFGLYQVGKANGHSKGLADASILSNHFPLAQGPIYYWVENEDKPVPAGVLENQEYMTLDTKRGTAVTVPLAQIQQKVFNTNDLARAQVHVPFTIVLPTYVPEKNRGPDIQGPLDSSGGAKNQITINYSVQYMGLIMIDESQNVSSNNDLTKNDPDLERLEINGTEVIRDKVDNTFRFATGGVSVYVYTQNLPGGKFSDDELLKVVQSMVGRAD